MIALHDVEWADPDSELKSWIRTRVFSEYSDLVFLTDWIQICILYKYLLIVFINVRIQICKSSIQTRFLNFWI